MSDHEDITFTEEKFRKFKRAYGRAINSGRRTFVFEGREIHVSYAKHMIAYLEVKFK